MATLRLVMPDTLVGRVLRSQSGQYWVAGPDGVVLHCTLRGRLKRERKAHTDLAVIGDRVRVARLAGQPDEGVIEEVLMRRNRFARRQPGGRGRYKEDVLVANLDRLYLVFACAQPPPNPRLIDRFLVIAELDGIEAAIVANKTDRVDAAELEHTFGLYQRLGYRVFATSATESIGLDVLRAELGARVSAFVGPSGVGKSSLLNALQPGLGLGVGAMSERLDKGRHTTRVAQLHPIPGGGWVADTPGIRELASFELPEDRLDVCFPEMRPYVARCRFSSCRHVREPDCAVREAVERGAIDSGRYESYVRIRVGEER